MGILTWPFARIAGWVDENPLSAVGVVVGIGALLALVLLSGISGVGAEGTFTDSEAAVTALSQTALDRPGFVIIALFGMAVFLFYDG